MSLYVCVCVCVVTERQTEIDVGGKWKSESQCNFSIWSFPPLCVKLCHKYCSGQPKVARIPFIWISKQVKRSDASEAILQTWIFCLLQRPKIVMLWPVLDFEATAWPLIYDVVCIFRYMPATWHYRRYWSRLGCYVLAISWFLEYSGW